MFKILPAALLLLAVSCNNKKAIVETAYIDSLIGHYTPSITEKVINGDVEFWQKKLQAHPEDFVSKGKYVQALTARFHLYQDIHDLTTADSLLLMLHKQFPGDASFLLSAATIRLLQHQFAKAKEIADSIGQVNQKSFAFQMLMSDIDFELGYIYNAKKILNANKNPSGYAYNFRLAKMDHYSGELDSAIHHMLAAANIAGDLYLEQAALSNAADLTVHAGELKKAYELYKSCTRNNSSDFHSLSKIGWLALVHDGNDSLANRIFQFVQQKIKSPDPLLNLSRSAELKDARMAKQYATQFVKLATDPVYGDMYNKYTIEAYTGILKDPAKAIAIAERELQNRRTPQTYAWLAWSLAAAGRIQEAYIIFKKNISGKPLEGQELYWMGKVMKLAGKGYNADEFFKAAEKNKYDLSPAMIKDLQQNL